MGRRAESVRVPRFSLALLIPLAILAAGCATHFPAHPDPRPPRPLNAERQALFSVGDSPIVERAESRVTDRRGDHDLHALRLWIGAGASVDGELYVPRGVDSAHPAPGVIVFPILNGRYVVARIIAAALARGGLVAVIPHQAEKLLPKESSPEQLSADFLASVREGRAFIEYLETCPAVDPQRLGSVGVSFGALRQVLLLADEPRLRANVLALAGLDLPEIITTSQEGMVRRYRSRRAALETCSEADINARLRAVFWYHDRRTAEAIDSRGLLLILAEHDNKVPIANGLALHEALGKPELQLLPLGHYTSIPAIPWMIDWMLAHFDAQFALTPE